MTPSEFKSAWIDNDHSLYPLSAERFKGLNLQQSTIDFLMQAGLPGIVAPYLNFVRDTSDIYDGINRLTKVYDTLDAEFNKYIVIGGSGDGNIIALNTELNDRVEWLNAEDFSSGYMNNSIRELAAMLIAYRNFVRTIHEENGEDAYLDSNFSDAVYETLKQKIASIEEKALIEEGFWKTELQNLLVSRKDFHASTTVGKNEEEV
ncbi:MAG TPA: SUKH-4 family immunity protein [Bacteroidia bacterium]